MLDKEPTAAYLYAQSFEKSGVERQRGVTVIYEFPLKQTLTGGNRER